MKRYGALGAALALLVLLGCYVLYGYLQESVSVNKDYATWPPDAAAIRASLGPSSTPAPGMNDKARHDQFVALFKQRYREHDPGVAVGIRFLTPTRVKLMCPARMEPWDMDNIAMSLWHETHDVFGTNYEVDIYETFIGMPPLKVGELRTVPMRPDIVHISYQYPNKVIYSPYGRRPATAARPNNSVSPAQTARPVL